MKPGTVLSPYLCNNVHNTEGKDEEERNLKQHLFYIYTMTCTRRKKAGSVFSPHLCNNVHNNKQEEERNLKQHLLYIYAVACIRRRNHRTVFALHRQWRTSDGRNGKQYLPHIYNDVHQKDETCSPHFHAVACIEGRNHKILFAPYIQWPTSEGRNRKRYLPHIYHDLHQKEETTKQYKHSPHIYNDVHQKEETKNI